MAADLADARAESPQWRTRLGDPAAYAAELRAAAGFPPPSGGTGALAGGWASWQLWRTQLARQSWAQPLVRHEDDIRQVWWVLRALLGALVVGVIAGSGMLALLLAIPAIIVSIWLGRQAQESRPSHVVNVVATGVALLACLPMVVGFAARQSSPAPDGGDADSMIGDSLAFKGQSVTNLYPFDANGKRLTGGSAVRPGRERRCAGVKRLTETRVGLQRWFGRSRQSAGNRLPSAAQRHRSLGSHR